VLLAPASGFGQIEILESICLIDESGRWRVKNGEGASIFSTYGKKLLPSNWRHWRNLGRNNT
jgi:hypothetical protein